jgi:hypothetical protein
MKTWRYDYGDWAQGQSIKTGRDYLAAVVPAAPLNAAGHGGPPPQAADSLAAAIVLADAVSGAQSRLRDWRQVPQTGDTIVEKQADATYSVLRIEPPGRATTRTGLADLDQAKRAGREALAPDGSTLWYRDYRDDANHLETID